METTTGRRARGGQHGQHGTRCPAARSRSRAVPRGRQFRFRAATAPSEFTIILLSTWRFAATTATLIARIELYASGATASQQFGGFVG